MEQITANKCHHTYTRLTAAYALWMPFIVELIFMLKLPESYTRVGVPVCCMFLIALYAFLMNRWTRPVKPDNIVQLYIPVFFPFICQTAYFVLFNLLGTISAIAVFFYSLLTLNLYGCTYSICHDDWHTMAFYNLLLNIFLMTGYMIGERSAAFITKRKYRPGKRRFVVIFTSCIIFAIVFSEVKLYQQRSNLVEPQGHGFEYENGYSSIDLEPYYVENPDNILVSPDEPSTFIITEASQMPILDGAEAAYPVYSAFASACYANIEQIQLDAKSNKDKASDEVIMPIRFTNTVRAYEKLIDGEVDIFFGAKPSKKQLEMAQEAGKELVLTPIGREAFVFFVSNDNTVENLSSDEIRGIYSGKINNWSKLGSEKGRILAFQRPANSGSQTMMEYFMGDVPLKDPLEYESHASMGGVIRKVAAYRNGENSIGYTFRYYASIMNQEASSTDAGIKLLSVDGAFPDTENIMSGKYPITTQLYAITLKDNSNGYVNDFVEWMIGPQGQKIVSDTGYVTIN